MKYERFLAAFCLINGCEGVVKKMKSSHEISFYYRTEGHNGDYLNYSDNLIYSNYKNRVLTAKDLFSIAKHYIDPVKAGGPVGMVNFVGAQEDENLPKSKWKNNFEERKYYVIAFLFSNGLERFARQPISLIGIMTWKNGKVIYFLPRCASRFCS
jgi:hypothetical protein